MNLEDLRNMKEKVQDTVRGLQDLTEEEREDVLSYLTKCLTTDEELKDLDERVRGPRKNSGREREKAKCRQQTHCRQSAPVGLVLTSHLLATGVSSPDLW